MYPTIVADFLAEVHLHVALFICGALGYLFMKRTKNVWPQRMASPPQKKSSPEAEEVEEEKKEQKEEEEQEQPAVEQAVAVELPSEPEVSAAVDEEESTVEEQVAECVAAPQVSERTTRILAKKAARKARKAQELLEVQQPEAEQEAEAIIDMPSEEEEVAQAEPVVVEEVPPTPPSTPTSEAAVPPAVEAAVAPAAPAEEAEAAAAEEAEEGEFELPPFAEEEEEVSSKPWTPKSQLKSVDWYTIEEPDHGLDTCAEPELSTAWERSSREESLEDTGSSNGAPFFEEEEGYGARQGSWYEYQQPSCQSWKEPVQRRAGPIDWEMPLDEMIRSPAEAEQVYSQLYDERLAAEQAQQSVQYQPVVCDDNQQYYTDGQQFYMLACITGPEGASDEGAGQEMRLLTDAQDPLHATFAANASPAGFVDVAMQGDQAMPMEQAGVPEDAWDICWTMTQ